MSRYSKGEFCLKKCYSSYNVKNRNATQEIGEAEQIFGENHDDVVNPITTQSEIGNCSMIGSI